MHDDPTLATLDTIQNAIVRLMTEMHETGSIARINGLVAALEGKLEILRVRLLTASCSTTIGASAQAAVYAITGSSPRTLKEQKISCELYDPVPSVTATRLFEIAEALGREQQMWHDQVVAQVISLRAAYMRELASTDSTGFTSVGRHFSHAELLERVQKHVAAAWEQMLDLLLALKEFEANPTQDTST